MSVYLHGGIPSSWNLLQHVVRLMPNIWAASSNVKPELQNNSTCSMLNYQTRSTFSPTTQHMLLRTDGWWCDWASVQTLPYFHPPYSTENLNLLYSHTIASPLMGNCACATTGVNYFLCSISRVWHLLGLLNSTQSNACMESSMSTFIPSLNT